MALSNLLGIQIVNATASAIQPANPVSSSDQLWQFGLIGQLNYANVTVTLDGASTSSISLTTVTASAGQASIRLSVDLQNAPFFSIAAGAAGAVQNSLMIVACASGPILGGSTDPSDIIWCAYNSLVGSSNKLSFAVPAATTVGLGFADLAAIFPDEATWSSLTAAVSSPGYLTWKQTKLLRDALRTTLTGAFQ